MARFLKFYATEDVHDRQNGGAHSTAVWLNIYGIDEIKAGEPRVWRDELKRKIKAQPGEPADDDGWLVVPQTELALHAVPRGEGRGHMAVHVRFITDGDPAEVTERIEQALQCDRGALPPPAPGAPARLGYAYAANNLQFLSVPVSAIDDYAAIEFRGRAARTAGEALAVAEPFSVQYPVSAVPINTRPASAPRLVVPIPGADNINVGRSADGRTLYFLGQDAAAAFGIAVLGHPQES